MLTLSLSRAERWKTSWIKAILWNSKNINKVDPFSPLALLSRKQSMRLFFIPSTVFSVLIPPLLPASRSSAWCDGRQKFSVRREIYAPTIVYCGVKPTSSSRVASAYVKARYIGSCTTVITSSTKALDEASRCALPWWKLEEEEEAQESPRRYERSTFRFMSGLTTVVNAIAMLIEHTPDRFTSLMVSMLQ